MTSLSSLSGPSQAMNSSRGLYGVRIPIQSILNITASTDAPGTFAIVPEPGGLAVLGIALVTLVGWRRFTTGVGSPKA